MKLVGRRTYIVCIVIAALAAVQKFLGVTIPNEIWLVLFALAVAATRAAVGAAKLIALLLIPALLLSGGCGAGYRALSQGSLVTVRSPTFVAAPLTNAVYSSDASRIRDSSQSAAMTAPLTAHGPIQLYAEQVQIMFFGGVASSNNVPLTLSFPITQ